MNAARCFQRREDYQPPQTPCESPFRKFTARYLACGSYHLRLVAQFDESTGEMAVVLVCSKCSQRETIPVRQIPK